MPRPPSSSDSSAERRRPAEPIQFTIQAPENAQFGGPISGGTGQAAQVSVSPDGRHVVFVAAVQNRFTLWIRSIGVVPPRSIAGTEDGSFPFWSPDSRFIGFFAAYGSNEAGPYQIYVQPFPPTGDKHQISRNGGGQPMWRGDGRELFFIGADAMMMAATVDTSRHFEVGVPQPLFPSRSPNTVLGRRSYAVTRDGKRFLIPALQDATSTPLTVVVNWLSAAEK